MEKSWIFTEYLKKCKFKQSIMNPGFYFCYCIEITKYSERSCLSFLEHVKWVNSSYWAIYSFFCCCMHVMPTPKIWVLIQSYFLDQLQIKQVRNGTLGGRGKGSARQKMLSRWRRNTWSCEIWIGRHTGIIATLTIILRPISVHKQWVT